MLTVVRNKLKFITLEIFPHFGHVPFCFKLILELDGTLKLFFENLSKTHYLIQYTHFLLFPALSSELQKLLDEAYALLKEKENEKDSLGKSMSDELAKVKADSERALNEAKSKMSVAQTEFETQISVLSANLQLAESKLEAEKQNLERLNKENSQTIIDLNTKLTQLQAAVDDKTLELNKGK